MQCEVTANHGLLTITLVGQLIFSDTAAFAGVLQQAKAAAAKTCVVNLTGLEQIDSSGLRMLLLVHDLCRDCGTELEFRGASGQVKEMLLHCHFHTIVRIDG